MTVPTTPNDAELLRLMMAGDEAAFTALYRRRQGGIYRFALQMCGSRSVAEDVTQEVFMALIRDAQHYDPSRGSLAAYLYGVARHHVLRRLERDGSYVSMTNEQADEDAQTPEPLIAQHDPLADLARSEMIQAVRQAVLALPAHYREVVVLCDLHEMSYGEAANVLGCAVGTIRSRLHRARSLLLEKLRTNADTNSAPDNADPARCFA